MYIREDLEIATVDVLVRHGRQGNVLRCHPVRSRELQGRGFCFNLHPLSLAIVGTIVELLLGFESPGRNRGYPECYRVCRLPAENHGVIVADRLVRRIDLLNVDDDIKRVTRFGHRGPTAVNSDRATSKGTNAALFDDSAGGGDPDHSLLDLAAGREIVVRFTRFHGDM